MSGIGNDDLWANYMTQSGCIFSCHTCHKTIHVETGENLLHPAEIKLVQYGWMICSNQEFVRRYYCDEHRPTDKDQLLSECPICPKCGKELKDPWINTDVLQCSVCDVDRIEYVCTDCHFECKVSFRQLKSEYKFPVFSADCFLGSGNKKLWRETN